MRFPRFTLFVLFISVFSTVQAQDKPTAESIIERYITVSGGRSLIEGIRSSKFEAVTLMPNGDSIQILVMKLLPGRFYQKVTMPSGESVGIVFNRNRGAVIMEGQATPIEDTAELDNFLLQSYILADLGYAALGYTMNYEGREKINGRNYHHVRFRSPKGSMSSKYFDTETGLLYMMTTANETITFADYKDFNGFIIPLSMKTLENGKVKMEVLLRTAAFNVDIDPVVFEF